MGPGSAPRDVAALRPAPLRQAPPPRDGSARSANCRSGTDRSGFLNVAEVQVWLSPIKKLSVAVKEDLRLGLVGPSLARQLTRLPAGNQEALLALARRETLTAQEVSGVIDLLVGASAEQAAFVLAKPREALAQVQGMPTALRDPRLSRAGNWLARHLRQALEALVRVENWLRTPNERELHEKDREILQPLLARVGDQASVVAELVLGPDLETGEDHERSDAS